eukprot:2496667-Amphidinium_carterae.1
MVYRVVLFGNRGLKELDEKDWLVLPRSSLRLSWACAAVLQLCVISESFLMSMSFFVFLAAVLHWRPEMLFRRRSSGAMAKMCRVWNV